MADLLGAFRAAGLAPRHHEAVARMQQALPGCREARVESASARSAHLVARSGHGRDPSHARPEDTTGVALAWCGTEALDSGSLLRALEQRRSPELASPSAAAVCTADPHALWLVADPFGLQPLYYAVEGDTLWFATRLAPLLAAGIGWNLDRRAVVDFFTYEHVTGDRTFADSVSLLPAGSVLRFMSGSIEVRPRQETDRSAGPISTDALADALHEELRTSVADSVRGATRVAIPLSGGLDSRALLGCATECATDIETWTFGRPGDPELRRAAEVARCAGVPNHVVELDGRYLPRWLEHGIAVTDGMVSCTQYHVTVLADRLAEGADVVLDGLGGDALTGAHLSPAMLLSRSPEAAASLVYRQRATAWADDDERYALFEADFAGAGLPDPREAVTRHAREAEEPWRGCHRFDLSERQRRFVQFGPHQLRPFVAVRTPFWSRGIADLMARADARQLSSQRAYLRMHARRLPALARVPDAARGLPLGWPVPLRFGKQVLDYAGRRLRRALGLPSPTLQPADYSTWFRTGLRAFAQERLLDGDTLEGVIRRSEVERVLREHESGARDHAARIGCLLTFEGWLRGVQTEESRRS